VGLRDDMDGPWDARLARWLVAPLRGSPVTPNHVTTLRLVTGLGSAAAFWRGTYGWSNVAAALLVISNLLDHADGELARLTGAFSRAGHVYDLASDAVVTTLLFIAIGAGVETWPPYLSGLSPLAFGAAAGSSIAFIFYVRMRIETLAGKGATQQASAAGFETEDILYLIPLITLGHGLVALLVAAGSFAPLYAIWVTVEYRRVRKGLESRIPQRSTGALQ
jgi:phosphatidylglycerophosphate synthase